MTVCKHPALSNSWSVESACMLTATKNSQSQCRARLARQMTGKGSERSPARPAGSPYRLTAARSAWSAPEPQTSSAAVCQNSRLSSHQHPSDSQKSPPWQGKPPLQGMEWHKSDQAEPGSSGEMPGQQGWATVMVLCNGWPPVMSQPQRHTQSQNKSHSYGYGYA